jgi:hypothetical protein
MCNKGVLHRDVSAGNLLIKIRQGADKSTVTPVNEQQFEETRVAVYEPLSSDDDKVGQLIDLDHAKWVQDTINPYTHGPPTESQSSDIQRMLNFGVESDVLELAWRYFGREIQVANYLYELGSAEPEEIESHGLTLDYLKWPKLVGTDLTK